MRFLPTVSNYQEKIDLKACFSFGNYSNLQDLCDSTVKHTVVNALGACFSNLAILEAEGGSAASGHSYTLNDESRFLIDLGSFVQAGEIKPITGVSYGPGTSCGGLGFRFAN